MSTNNAPGVISLFVVDKIRVSENVRWFCWGGVFSTEDMTDIVELAQVIRYIRARLVAEGKLSARIGTKNTP